MFAGHLGVALAIGRAEPRVNLGVLAGAALLLDVILWLLVLIGWESVTIPADFPRTHQPIFVFPYSHGLLAAAAWSVLAGAVTLAVAARRGTAGPARAGPAMFVAAAVFSHWLLDAIVHAPQLPLLATDSHRVGAGLWNHMPLALLLESAVAVAGLWLFLMAAGLPRRRAAGLAALTLLTLAFTILGMTLAPAPPSAHAMAASSLLTIVAVCALAGWLGRSPRSSEHARAKTDKTA